MVVEFFDRESLSDWLDGHRSQVAIAIAARSALRVLPVILEYARTAGKRRFEVFALPMLRALSISRVAAAWPARGAEIANTSADATNIVMAAHAYASSSNASAAYLSAVNAIAEAAYAAYATIAAARAAADAADSAASAIDTWAWRALNADITFLRNDRPPAALMRLPLWVEGMPEVIQVKWNDNKLALLAFDEAWFVWTNWYDDILRGANHPNSRLEIEELEFARALIPDGTWERGPAHVNSLIAALEAEYRHKIPGPEEIGPQDPTAARFRESNHVIDADDLAGRDAVATDPIARDLHDGALAFAQALHDVVAIVPPGSNRPRPLATTVTRLIEATGANVAAARPGLLVPLAAALQVALDADARRERDPDLEGVPLSADEREAIANASNAYKTWINTDPYLSTLEGARLRTAYEPMDTRKVDAMVQAAVDANAATPAAAELVNDAKQAGPQSQFFNSTVLNFIRRGLKIAAITAAGVYSGAVVAAWLVTNAETILGLLANNPMLLDVATRLIAVLKQMPLAGIL